MSQSLLNGLVISYFGNSVSVEADDGQVFQCFLHRNQELPVVGDRVTIQIAGDQGQIKNILPRSSLLSRGDTKGRTKPIAANVDILFIVMAPQPVFSNYLIDRYLVAAELLNIKALLLVNKIDLLGESSKDALQTLISPYLDILSPVILSSVINHEGFAQLISALNNQTGVLVGPSGVGKSSIISLLSHENIRVAPVSQKGSGKHTTTTTRLYHLPEGGNLIDSPGVRDFNLWTIQPRELLQGFKEFQPYITHCKFRDCWHLSEPGCALKEAAQIGKINPLRLLSYQTLMKEING